MDAAEKLEQLETELYEAIDELDRINREEPPDSLETGAKQAGVQCQIWSIKTSIALRTNKNKEAYEAQSNHKDWEQRRTVAEKQRHLKMLPEIIERLDAQDAQADALQVIEGGEVPDFSPDDE